MVLTGCYVRAIDEKLRVAIPKRLRDAMEPGIERGLYVAPGTDGSLALYTEEVFASLADRLAEVSPQGQNVRAFRRLYYAQAERVDVDGQGRIRIPPELAKLAELAKEAVLLGVHDHLELWDKSHWEAYLTEKSPQYDEIAEQAWRRQGD